MYTFVPYYLHGFGVWGVNYCPAEGADCARAAKHGCGGGGGGASGGGDGGGVGVVPLPARLPRPSAVLAPAAAGAAPGGPWQAPACSKELKFGIERILSGDIHSRPADGCLRFQGPYAALCRGDAGGPCLQGAAFKRKRAWSRAVFSSLQRKGLEKRFQVQKYVTKPDRRQLAAMLGLTDAQVKVWFQNRRMKWRHSKEAEAQKDKDKEKDKDKDVPAESAQVAGSVEALSAGGTAHVVGRGDRDDDDDNNNKDDDNDLKEDTADSDNDCDGRDDGDSEGLNSDDHEHESSSSSCGGGGGGDDAPQDAVHARPEPLLACPARADERSHAGV
ncbi:H2.0-like homeobox protein isoform X2 [Lethenteron reissneri]|uniref:H2.0-like homeobox protein isoform X2 n=1 Tax=Lethenteron reissneri TaxID=7753 RepID=UPI002AB60B28|nr:H2.0-like homeobox protein isoform X2 [Lethenteron reissneri]